MRMSLWLSLMALMLAFGSESLFANSLKLKNDSPYTLRASIRGADNTFLGEVILSAQHSMTWTDVYGRSGYYGAPNAQMQEGYASKTPYTVIWYCMDGNDFSISRTVATGSLVNAQSGDGKRTCSATKPEAYPVQPQGQYLHPLPPPANQ